MQVSGKKVSAPPGSRADDPGDVAARAALTGGHSNQAGDHPTGSGRQKRGSRRIRSIAAGRECESETTAHIARATRSATDGPGGIATVRYRCTAKAYYGERGAPSEFPVRVDRIGRPERPPRPVPSRALRRREAPRGLSICRAWNASRWPGERHAPSTPRRHRPPPARSRHRPTAPRSSHNAGRRRPRHRQFGPHAWAVPARLRCANGGPAGQKTGARPRGLEGEASRGHSSAAPSWPQS